MGGRTHSLFGFFCVLAIAVHLFLPIPAFAAQSVGCQLFGFVVKPFGFCTEKTTISIESSPKTIVDQRVFDIRSVVERGIVAGEATSTEEVVSTPVVAYSSGFTQAEADAIAQAVYERNLHSLQSHSALMVAVGMLIDQGLISNLDSRIDTEINSIKEIIFKNISNTREELIRDISSGSDVSVNGTLTTPTITTPAISDPTISGSIALSSLPTNAVLFTNSSGVMSGVTSLGVDDSGNLFIGTTTAQEKLTVDGSIYLEEETPTTTSKRLYNIAGNLYWNGALLSASTSAAWSASGGDVYRPTGSVGIGTSTPSRLLSVAGDVIFTGALYDNNNTAGTNGTVLQSTGTGFQWVATSSLGLDADLSGSSLEDLGDVASMTQANGDILYWNGSAWANIATSSLGLSTDDITEGSNLYYTDARVNSLLVASSTILKSNTESGLESFLSGVSDVFTNNDIIGDANVSDTITASNYLALTDWYATTTDALSQGSSNFYYATNLFAADLFGTTTDALSEGSTNLYSQWASNASDISYTTGSVGIGTTSPATLLHVVNTGVGSYTPSANANEFVIEHDGNAGLSIISGTTSRGSIYFGEAGDPNAGRIQYNQDLNSLALYTADVERFTIDSSGNVGIGTTSPASTLDVWGGFRAGTSSIPAFFVSSSSNYTGLATDNPIERLDISNGVIRMGNNVTPTAEGDNAAYFGKVDNQAFVSHTGGFAVRDNGTVRLIVDTDGNVGIGTTTPSELLHIAGDTRIEGALYDNANSAGTNGYVLQSDGSGFNWVATSTLGLGGGGAGASAYTDLTDTPGSYDTGEIFYANSSTSIIALAPGSDGTVLKISGGVPTWGADIGGSGGSGVWASSTDNLLVYPADPNDVVVIGGSATTSSGYILEVIGDSLFDNIEFAAATTSQFAFGTDGIYDGTNFGFGTTTPNSKLVVDGSSWITGNLDLDGYLTIGSAATAGDGMVRINESVSNNNDYSSFSNITRLTANIASTRNSFANYNRIEADDVTTGANIYNLAGVYGEVQIDGTADVDTARGGQFIVDQNSSTNVNSAYVISNTLEVDAGSQVSNGYGYFSDLNNLGTITNYYGIFLQDIAEGTVSDAYAIWVGEGDVTLDSDGDGAPGGNNGAGDLYFGEGQDSAIWYDGSDMYINPRRVGSGDLIVSAGSLLVGTTTGSSLLTVGGGVTIDGTATATNLVLTNALPVSSGGTGNSTFTTGDILYASDSATLTRLAAGSEGQVLKLSSGIPSWSIDLSGDSAVWATSSDGLRIYPFDISDTVIIGGTATTATGYSLEVIGGVLADNAMFTDATTTNLAVGSDTISDITGDGLQVTSNTLSVNCSDLEGTGVQCSSNNIALDFSEFDTDDINVGSSNFFSKWADSFGTNVYYNAAGADYVGIGESDPDFSLEIAGTNGSGYLGLSTNAGGDGDILIVNGSGDVGIATTTPSAKFAVSGNSYFGGNLTVESNVQFAALGGGVLTTDANGNLSTTSVSVSESDLTLTQGYTYVGDSSNNPTGTTTIFINTDMEVGIGTTSPEDKFHIVGGNLLLENTQAIRWKNNAATANTIMAYDSSNNLQVGSGIGGSLDLYSTNPILFNVGGSEHARLGTAGQLGLGDTSADFQLELVGTSTNGYFGISSAADNDGDILTIDTSGNVGIGTTSPASLLTVAGSGSFYDTLSISSTSNPMLSLIDTGTGAQVDMYDNSYHFYINKQSPAGGNAFIELNPTVTDSQYSGHVRVGRDYVGDNVTGHVRFSVLPGGGVTTPVHQLTGTTDSYLMSNQIGNLGIGTSSPSTFIHVAHADPVVRLQDIDAGSDVYSEIDASGANGRLILSADVLGNGSSPHAAIEVGGTEHLRVSSTGVNISNASGVSLLAITDGSTNAVLRANSSAGTGDARLDLYSSTTESGIIRFNDGSNAGLIEYDHTTDDLAFTAGGTERLTIDSNGNVGIGTTTPGTRLHVIDTSEQLRLGYDSSTYLSTTIASNGYVTREITGGNGYYFHHQPTAGGEPRYIFTNADTGSTINDGFHIGLNSNENVFVRNKENTDLDFYTNDTQRLTITGAGNVGIGTTTPEWPLHIYGTDATTVIEDTDGRARLALRNSSALTANDELAYINFNGYTTSGTEDVFARVTAYAATSTFGSQSGFLAFSTNQGANLTEAMRIDQSGNVGIGTNTPQVLMHIYNDTADAVVRIEGGTNLDARLQLFGDQNWILVNDGDGSIGSADYFHIYDQTASTSRLTFDTSGNVGIGTTSPASTLDVWGDLSVGTSSVATLFVDVSTGRIGVGTTTPQAALALAAGSSQSEGIHFSDDIYIYRANSGRLDLSGADLNLTSGGNIKLGNTVVVTSDREVQAADGDAADPAFRFVSDVDTGLFGNGSDALGFSTGGSEAMRIDASGNVGIGTTTPLTQFSVANLTTGTDDIAIFGQDKPSGVSNIYIGSNTLNDTSGAIRYDHDNNFLQFHVTGDGPENPLVIANGGNIGVGTSSPQTDLHISGNGAQALRIESTDNSSSVLQFADPEDGNVGSISYNHTNDSLTLRANTINALVIDSSGNVGVGTTTPSQELHVVGDIQLASEGRLLNGSGERVELSDITNTVSLYAGGSTILTALNSGVGIGTTTPTGLLHVYSGASGASIPSGADDLIIENNGDDAGMSIVSDASNDARIILGDSTDSSSGIIRWDNSENEFIVGTGIGGSELVFNTGNSVERVRIDSSGNMGIGTTSPQEVLHVSAGEYGGSYTTTIADLIVEDSDNTGINILSGTDGLGGILFGDPSSSLVGRISYDHSIDDLAFFTGGVEAMTIDGSGDVGIGTSTPTAQLHTTGSVRFSTFGAGTMETDSSGNVSVSSDERLKDISGGFTRGLDAILGIQPITYSWNESSGLETSDRYSGFSAQNVQDNIPEAVGEGKDGYLTLSSRPIVAALVNSTQEQQVQLAQILMTGSTSIGTDIMGNLVDDVEDTVWEKVVNLVSGFSEGVLELAGLRTKVVFTRDLEAEYVKTEELCIGNTCITEAELLALLEGQSVEPANTTSQPITNNSDDDDDTEPTDTIDTGSGSNNNQNDSSDTNNSTSGSNSGGGSSNGGSSTNTNEDTNGSTILIGTSTESDSETESGTETGSTTQTTNSDDEGATDGEMVLIGTSTPATEESGETTEDEQDSNASSTEEIIIVEATLIPEPETETEPEVILIETASSESTEPEEEVIVESEPDSEPEQIVVVADPELEPEPEVTENTPSEPEVILIETT